MCIVTVQPLSFPKCQWALSHFLLSMFSLWTTTPRGKKLHLQDPLDASSL